MTKEITAQDEDQIFGDDPEDDEPMPDELTVLKERAKSMGLTFSPNIGLAALRGKVNEHLASGDPAPAGSSADDGNDESDANDKDPAPAKIETFAEMRTRVRKEQLRLVRLRIMNMNPEKKDYPGEIFTVANEVVGIVKKFIPYGAATDDGYHVPWIIYKQLRARKFQQHTTRKDPRVPGGVVHDYRMVPEFNLEVLPDLTQEELDRLAAAQAAAMGIATE